MCPTATRRSSRSRRSRRRARSTGRTRKDPQRAKDLARALYAAYFLEDLDISNADTAIAIAAKCGLGADEVRAGINDQAIKDATKTEVEKALAIGAFGSPYIVIDGEAFWGADRLDQIDRVACHRRVLTASEPLG